MIFIYNYNRFGSVLLGSVRLEYLSFSIRYFGILPDSVVHWSRPVDDRTEPNLPNTEASVRYYSVRFGLVGYRYRNTEPNLWGIF